MEAELKGEGREEVRKIMNKNDDDSKDAFVEYLARKMLNKALFGQILTSKFEEVAD